MDRDGGVGEFTADGRVLSGPLVLRYEIIDSSHFRLIAPEAPDNPITCAYVINGNQMVLTFIEVKGMVGVPRELRAMEHMSWFGGPSGR